MYAVLLFALATLGCGDDRPPECASSADCDSGAADADTGALGDTVIVLDGTGVGQPCALRRNGQLLCVETPTTELPRFSSLGTFPGAVSIVRGASITCLLFDSGNAQCLESGVFTDVPDLSDAVQLDTWVGHVCAVRETGEVVCWGDNSFEQIEAGGAPRYDSPHTIASVTDAVQVATARLSSCVLHRDGTVSCWGDDFGAAPTPVAGVTGGAAITAGHFHYSVTGDTGDVQSFGGSRTGTEAMVPSPITDAAEAIAFHSESCYRSFDGSVSCWGTPFSPGRTEAQPLEPIAGLDDAVLLANHCALRSTGIVTCWGAARTATVDATGL